MLLKLLCGRFMCRLISFPHFPFELSQEPNLFNLDIVDCYGNRWLIW